ncbi:DUF2262 domain-containing protein [Campylobacter lari]|uniref:DUF2262 domain-containing protein n=1 Tax=Campylobacter lari TaxID=201 RepID=UPI0021533131|nr:DUF2262 domain-containing protein [Campylobacter lari]MCR6566455.1 DUF2262 domain-containing protein [Campylobacter lari]
MEDREIKEFNSQFEDEILDIAFVLKEYAVGAGKVPNKEKHYKVSILAIAYKNFADNTILENENISIEQKSDDTKYYFDTFKNKTIARLKVRKHKDFDSALYKRFLLVELIENNYKDEDLKPILDEYIKPVYYKDEVLGIFELDKGLNTFINNINWVDKKKVEVTFNNDNIENSIQILRKIFEDKKELDKKIKEYIASQLLEEANNYNEDADKDEIDEKQFAKFLTFESIAIRSKGIDFYVDDGDVFWGHVIIVESDFDFNFKDAYIVG